jgi:MFS family permease
MTIYLITFIAFVAHTAFAGGRVAVSLYALDHGASQVTIGILVALFAFSPMVFSIPIGKLVDRVSPRLPMMVGTLVMGLTLLLPVLFPGVAVLYLCAFILGLTNQFFNIPMDATVGAVGGMQRRVHNYAMLSMGWSAAGFVGPLVAGFAIDYIGRDAAFPLLAAFSATAFFLLWWRAGLFPGAARASAKHAAGSVLDLWRVPTLRNTFIATGVVSAGDDLFRLYLPIYAYSVGVSASAIGIILGTVAAATFLIRSFLPWLAKRLSEVEILTYSIFVAAGAFVALPFFASAYALAVIAFALGLGVGCANPMSMALLYAMSPAGRIAEATGLRKTVNHGTGLVAPLVFSSVGTAFGFTTVFVSSALVLLLGGYLMRKAGAPR